ncbi:MAG: hypothetical protein methR_P0798 [Methyloprofundus sp.]|nr:MAG: hypothetical protein methR_P0798 [Methyloprofundus sp.]
MNLTIQIISNSASFNVTVESGYEIVNFSSDSTEALKFSEAENPAIIFLEYEIAHKNTELYIKSLLNESPDSKVILAGKNLPDSIIVDCLLSGLYGYVEMTDINQLFNKVVRLVGQGEAWVSRRLVGLLIERFRD